MPDEIECELIEDGDRGICMASVVVVSDGFIFFPTDFLPLLLKPHGRIDDFGVGSAFAPPVLLI